MAMEEIGPDKVFDRIINSVFARRKVRTWEETHLK